MSTLGFIYLFIFYIIVGSYTNRYLGRLFILFTFGKWYSNFWL